MDKAMAIGMMMMTLLFWVNITLGAEEEEAILSFIGEAPTLFSGYVAGVTMFDCNRDARDRVELLKKLDSTGTTYNSVFGLNDSFFYFPALAWAKGHEGKEIPSDAHRQLFVLDSLNCPDVLEFLEIAENHKIFSFPFKWLILQRSSNDLDALSSIYLEVNSEFTIWNLETNRLSAAYRRAKDQDLEFEYKGTWYPESRRLDVQGVNKNATSERRKNLGLIELKSSLVITHPDTLNHITEYRDPQIDTIAKCNYPWVLQMIEMFNATISFQNTNTWGYPSPNGSWSGMVGMLQRGEIDFGGVGTFLNKERMKIVHYISLSTSTGSRFIFRQPPLSSVSNLFRLPFRNSVWLGSFALLLLLVGMLYPAMRLEWLRYQNELKESESNPPDLSDDILVVMGAVSQQGSWYEPKSLTTRIIVFMGLVAALNLYSAYTANIVALLQSTTTSIRTLQDLLDSPLTLGVHDTVWNRYYFTAYKDPIRRAIYEEKVEPRGSKKNNWMTVEDGILRMKWDSQFAFHVERGSGYKFIQETFEEADKCGFQEIDYLNVFSPHFVVRKRSPYIEIIRIAGLKLRETGLRTREVNKWYTKKPVCGSARRFVSVGLTECYGAFLTLSVGNLIALGIFILEHLKKNFYPILFQTQWINNKIYF